MDGWHIRISEGNVTLIASAQRGGPQVPSVAGTLYVKFTANVAAEFLLLSFKEKDDA